MFKQFYPKQRNMVFFLGIMFIFVLQFNYMYKKPEKTKTKTSDLAGLTCRSEFLKYSH